MVTRLPATRRTSSTMSSPMWMRSPIFLVRVKMGLPSKEIAPATPPRADATILQMRLLAAPSASHPRPAVRELVENQANDAESD